MRQTIWRLKSALCRFSSSKEEEVQVTVKEIQPELSPASIPESLPESIPASPPANASTSISPSAASMVLRTPEIVEMILSHLSMQDLLPIQRTSRTVRDILRSSAPLQRKLFLAPALAESPDQETDNPYLKALFPRLGTYLLTGNPKWRPKFIQALADDDTAHIADLFWDCEGASWRSMYLTQPPVKEMTLYAGVEEGKGGRSRLDLVNAQVTIKSADGITMGMVMDASAKARRKARCGDVKRNDSGYASLDLPEMERDAISVAVVELDVEDD